MKHLIVDTNFLMIPYQFKVDLLSEFERLCPGLKVVVLDKTMEELELIIRSQKSKFRAAASFALFFIKSNKIGMMETVGEGDADHHILTVARRGDVVATQDKELKQQLKEKGIPVVIMRQKNHLDLIQ